MLLADLGADVVEIEQPGSGDPFRSYRGTLYSPQFRAYNARKRSLTLNLKAPQAGEVFDRLALEADVLIENYRPGVLRLAAPAQTQPASRLLFDHGFRKRRSLHGSSLLRHGRTCVERLSQPNH